MFDDRARSRGRSVDDAIGSTFSPAGNPLGGSMFTYQAPTSAPSANAGAADPFGMFDDPGTALLMQTIKKQMGEYSQPVAFDKDTMGVLDFLKGQMAGGVSSGSGNPLLGDFITQGRKRIAELEQEPFSAGEEAALKTKAKDQITVDRDAQRQMALEDMSRRGVADSSGVLQERYANIDRAYSSADAKAMNDLMLYISGERQNRKDKAAGLSQQLSQAGMQEEQIANSARESSSARIMQAASTIANLQAQQRGETRANQQQVLNLAAMMAQLPMDRLNMMMGVLNGSGGNNAGSLFNNTLALSNTQGRQNEINASANDGMLEGLSSMFTYFANRGGKK